MTPESTATPLSASDLAAAAELGDEAKALLRPDMPPPLFVQSLIDNEAFADAVRVLAHALPKREAVWWAWSCARKVVGANPPEPVSRSLSATEKWIVQPTDENRREAMRAAEGATLETPAGCAGLGAFVSGGSLAPPDLPPAPPGEYLTARAVAGSITMAAVLEPETAAEKFRTFLSQGMELTHKIKLWDRSGKE